MKNKQFLCLITNGNISLFTYCVYWHYWCKQTFNENKFILQYSCFSGVNQCIKMCVLILCVCVCRYVVERRWYEQWKEFVETGDQNSSSFPGQIDNTELFEGQWTPRSASWRHHLPKNQSFIQSLQRKYGFMIWDTSDDIPLPKTFLF